MNIFPAEGGRWRKPPLLQMPAFFTTTAAIAQSLGE